jgi:hypothetical protein
MNLNKYRPIWTLLISAILIYGLHKMAFYFFLIDTNSFYYSLETLYGFFLFLSLIVVLILLKINDRNFDQIGMTFLAVTSIKMILSYVALRPVLNLVPTASTIEKNSFFMIFVVFLSIETLITIRILNENGQNSK